MDGALVTTLLLAFVAAAGLAVAGRARRLPGTVVLACSALPLLGALIALVAPGALSANGPDGIRYLDQITVLRTGGLGALLDGHVASGKELYPILLLPLTALAEPTLGLLAVANAALAGAAIVVAQPGGHPEFQLANRWIRFYPFLSASVWFFMLLPLREGAIVLALVVWTSHVGERRRPAHQAAALVALVFLRPVVAFCAAFSLAVLEVRSRRLVHRPAVMVAGLALAAGLVTLPPIRSQILGVTAQRVAADRNFNASISTSGLPPADGTSWATLAAGLPRDLANVWLRPNPVVDRSAFAVATVDTLALLALTRAAVRSRRQARQAIALDPEAAHGARIPLARATFGLWFACSMAVAYALTVGDLGQLLRGRLAVLAVLWQSQLYEKEPFGHANPPRQPTNRLWRRHGAADPHPLPGGDGSSGDGARGERHLPLRPRPVYTSA